MIHCSKCNKVLGEYLLSAYGDTVCEACWDKYIMTDEGKLEFLLGICLGDYPAADFDDEFLLEVVASWNANKERVRDNISEGLFHRCDIRAEVLSKL
jgi:hypothetical protein